MHDRAIENSSRGKLAHALKRARDHLIQIGTSNRLVHTTRFAKRSKAIDIVKERSDDVFRILLREGKRMRFDHDPAVESEQVEGEPRLITRHVEDDESRFVDLHLQTRLGEDQLQKKLLGLAREAKTLEEEQGVNVLYLALGFLNWYEDERSEVLRSAPLILLPVALKRNERTSRYELEARSDDIVTNEPLKRRLNEDFAIKLPDIPEGDEWLASEYFARVEQAVSSKSRWSADRDGMQLGFFSFAKLLMMRDLEVEHWPDESAILDHPLLVGLLEAGFETDGDDGITPRNLDELYKPSDLIQVMDADASQTMVIEAVRQGKNLVVKGPPGTGKSQTITNIIASAVHDGKTVLFMAEKMAALNVVHSRLVQIGLQDICIELHSRAANKRQVLQELGRTLEAAGTIGLPGDSAGELQNLRDRLNALAGAMHTSIGQTGFTPYRAISTLVRLRDEGFAPADCSIPGVKDWTPAQLSDALAAARAIAQIVQKAGPKKQHPFYGSAPFNLLPPDVQRLDTKISELLNDTSQAWKDAYAVTDSVGIEHAPTPGMGAKLNALLNHVANLPEAAVEFARAIAVSGDSKKALDIATLGTELQSLAGTAESVFTPVALGTQISHLRSGLASGLTLLGRFGGRYRAASTELQSLCRQRLPKKPQERLAIIDQLLRWQQLSAQLSSHEEEARRLFGHFWKGVSTDFQAIGEAARWNVGLSQIAFQLRAPEAVHLRRFAPTALTQLGQQVEAASSLVARQAEEILSLLNVDVPTVFGVATIDAIPMDRLGKQMQLWKDNLDRLDEWRQLSTAYRELQQHVGEELTVAAESGQLSAEDVQSTIRYVHAEALFREFAAGHPSVVNLTSAEKAELIDRFRDRETRRRKEAARQIRAKHLAAIPRGGLGAMGYIKAEIAKRRGHRPIRRLMADAGPVIQQIKPVMLLSPISIAQYIPPGKLQFDLLVIDEASQVRPEDALGAIARARQLVVVGDRQQLPPTNFFDRAVSDGDGNDEAEDEDQPSAPKAAAATELESILTLCEARGLPTRMLEWHYRSRHPSLIEVSNDNFYEGRLVLFPSPLAQSEHDGLKLRRVNGAYDRGGKRNNPIEAEAVARAVAAHARQFPSRSLGVVTFSTTQRDAVTFWLDKLRQEDGVLDDFMREGRQEEFFVKSIENVQGDERDVIFISVGYGPRIAGHRLDSMAFGPVSTEGGERRLNVLFTRARYKTEVFVSFAPGDIDLNRTQSKGARVLKQFLQFAESGKMDQPRITGEDPDSDFEVAVASAIRALGYEVDHQVGSAGYRIDLAVSHADHPGRYILAVECDGATYHSALWARERDRQRQEVLEGLGWRFHRIWSTDWFYRRAEEIRRLEKTLSAACESQHDAEFYPVTEPKIEELEIEAVSELQDSGLPDYVLADFPVPHHLEPHEVSISQMADIAAQIIDVEGPVHEEEIARRVAGLFKKQKAGSRISGNATRALSFLKTRRDDLVIDGPFWCTAEQQAHPPLRNRSRAPLSLRKAAMLPPLEIDAAIVAVVGENGALAQDDIPRAVALHFGFQRTGPEFRPAIEPRLTHLLAQGRIVRGPAGITLP